MESGPGVLEQLDREWARIAQGCRGRRALRGWWAAGATERDRGTLGGLVEWINERGHPEASDAALLVLVRHAPEDDLAARTALQAMMPAMKNLTAKFCTCGAWDSEETAAIVVAAMWERVRNYPVERRPAKVSANLALDTRQKVWRAGMKHVHGHVPRS